MAPRKNTPPPAAPPAAPPAEPPAPTPDAPAEFTWDQLAPAIPMPAKQGTGAIHVNVLASVHESIRRLAETSLITNTARVAAKAGSSSARPRVDYHWDVQPVPDEEWGKKLVKALGKYAKYRPSDGDIPFAGPDVAKGQCTARTGVPMLYLKEGDKEPVAVSEGTEGAFWGVRYSVRPLEQRGDANRLPGTA